MDHHKQLQDIEALIQKLQKLLEEIELPSENKNSNIEAREELMKQLLAQLSLLLSAAYETHKLPELAKRIIPDMEALDLLSQVMDHPIWIWSPRLARGEQYYLALHTIVQETKRDRWMKMLETIQPAATIFNALGIVGIVSILISSCAQQKDHEQQLEHGRPTSAHDRKE